MESMTSYQQSNSVDQCVGLGYIKNNPVKFHPDPINDGAL